MRQARGKSIMSITSLTRSLFLLLAATLVLAPSARGVEREHDIVPFIDPLSFDPDFQFFAPAELGDFGETPDVNTGWFADYKRAYMWVSRPETELSFTEGDFSWSNIIDVGFMKEDEGWFVSGMHMAGPNEADSYRQLRINRVELDDIDPTDPPLFPPEDLNDPETRSRVYNITRSLNIARFTDFELNKVWRMEPLHRGGNLEPFMGFRYMGFLDRTQRDTYTRTDATGSVIFPIPDGAVAVIEVFNIDQSWFQNDMFGGQLGMRWSEYKSRWILSNELRVFALQNFQAFNEGIDTVRTLYAAIGNDGATTAETTTRTGFSTHDAEFVFGFDVRFDAAFMVTRDVNILIGAQVMHIPQGIGRGLNEFSNSQDLTMAGSTFGVQYNR
jgi:hypothetical protein